MGKPQPATVVVQRDTLPNTAPKQHSGASGATPPHMTHKLADPNPGQAHPRNHQVQVATIPLNHLTSIILQTIQHWTEQYPFTPHSHHQPHQVVRNGQNCQSLAWRKRNTTTGKQKTGKLTWKTLRCMKEQTNRSASNGSTDYNKQHSAQTLHLEQLSQQEQVPQFLAQQQQPQKTLMTQR